MRHVAAWRVVPGGDVSGTETSREVAGVRTQAGGRETMQMRGGATLRGHLGGRRDRTRQGLGDETWGEEGLEDG